MKYSDRFKAIIAELAAMPPILCHPKTDAEKKEQLEHIERLRLIADGIRTHD